MTSQPPPPGDYPAPPPGNTPPPPPGGGFGGPPDNNLVWGILVTVFCCLPLGIVSIIKATQVSNLWAQGQPAEAQRAADDAKKFAIWGAIAGAVVAVLSGILWVIFAVVMVNSVDDIDTDYTPYSTYSYTFPTSFSFPSYTDYP